MVFEYGVNDQLSRIVSGERATEYSYDGLGRELSQTSVTGYGSVTTESAWSGTSVVQRSNTVSGVTALVRDALGNLALQAGEDIDARWALLDGVGSTVAQVVGGSVTELANYSHWGSQDFESVGWDAAVNFTGETTDAGYGLSMYLSRTYDPMAGVWLSQDSWRGLLMEPQTVARYGYVLNSPTTLTDELGFKPLGKCDGPCQPSKPPAGKYLCYINGKPYECNEAAGTSRPVNPTVTQGYKNQVVYQASVSKPQVKPKPTPSTRPQAKSPSGNNAFVAETHCAGAGKFQRCQERGSAATGVPFALLSHYFFGGGATVYLDWGYFKRDRAFYNWVYANLAVGQAKQYTPLGDNLSMHMAIGTYTITRTSQNCFTVYYLYNFDPDKWTNVPYLPLYVGNKWGLRVLLR
ncbi:RHS repeat-associated core domain-containing protein [Lysinibacter sp. HNR]|nr:RHS repeat-associated core domain-containing protein [Lysinibacter sp. HNR]WGD38696.1 RHS repeat-associated core domain-containing protein [Lysinibacter sp. HNR]